MEVSRELKHLLLEVLPSPAKMAQGRLLCIQNHLAMVCDSLWAINSMIVIPEIKILSNDIYTYWKIFYPQLDVAAEFADWKTNVAAEFADWKINVAVAIIDVGELLSRIMDWEASLHHSVGGNTQQVDFRHTFLVELKEMLCDLNSLVLRGSVMGLQRDPMSSMNPLREDYSIVLKNEVVGREEDLEKLIAIFQQKQQLVPSNNDRDDGSNPFVIVILGREGVGKTTMAHMIYHHTWVRQQFHHRIWVDLPLVSTFKMINIIGKEFARSINNKEYCDQKLQLELPLQAMWEYINEQLDGSRYLLVLHCENLDSLKQQDWNELKNILLRVGGPGSAVLIIHKSSTESKDDMGFLNGVKDNMGFLNGVKDITTYELNPLSTDAWLKLSKRYTVMKIPQEKDELLPFACSNLYGYTFGAKIFGLPRLTFLDEHAVLEEIYGARKFPFVFSRLLQYRDLFHANTHDDAHDEVIFHMLTAEYLLPAEGLEPGWIERYYSMARKFWSRRMVYLQHMRFPEESTTTTTVPRCCRYLCLKINRRAAKPFRMPTMPVEVNSKLIALILQEDDEEIALRVYKKRSMKAAAAISKFLDKMWVRLVHLRILVVENSMIQSLPSEVSKLVNLRYLHLSKLKMELLPKSLFDLLHLRILCLLRCEKLQKIPEQLHKLKKLQILKLAYCTKLQQLPKSITRLQNLEVLDVEGCCWLRELPEDLVDSFKSLRILNVAGCASLSQIPCGIEQLIGLRKLSGIFVGVDGGFGLTQLQALTNLQELRLRNLEGAEKTQTEVLMGQQSLRVLTLHWGGEEANENSSESAAAPLQVLEALRPDVHLKRLAIMSYKGLEFPTWMSKQQLGRLDSLVEVRLINLMRCATLPSLGQLPHLKKLEIGGMDLITHIDDTFYGDDAKFPMLRELTFSEMLALEKWSVPKIKHIDYFPELRQLTLIQCPKLKEIDRHSLPYAKMRVWLNNETIWSAEFCSWDNLQYIQIIEIVGCQELRRLPQGMQRLKLLYKMTINSCNNLATLVALDSLGELNIYACPMLAFDLEETFTRLGRLRIKGCPKMQKYHDAWKKKDEERRRAREEEEEEEEEGEGEEQEQEQEYI